MLVFGLAQVELVELGGPHFNVLCNGFFVYGSVLFCVFDGFYPLLIIKPAVR